MSVDSISTVAPSGTPVMDGSDGLTNEALFVYLQTRLGGVDEQIQGMFEKQQGTERVRKAIRSMQDVLAKLENDTTDKELKGTKNEKGQSAEYETQILGALADIKSVDPVLGAQMEAELVKEGGILFVTDGLYLTSEVDCTTKYLDGLNSQLESSAQLEMIRLQSLMSSRQTAIQLATNMVSALNESTKAVAGNVGR